MDRCSIRFRTPRILVRTLPRLCQSSCRRRRRRARAQVISSISRIHGSSDAHGSSHSFTSHRHYAIACTSNSIARRPPREIKRTAFRRIAYRHTASTDVRLVQGRTRFALRARLLSPSFSMQLFSLIFQVAIPCFSIASIARIDVLVLISFTHQHHREGEQESRTLLLPVSSPPFIYIADERKLDVLSAGLSFLRIVRQTRQIYVSM